MVIVMEMEGNDRGRFRIVPSERIKIGEFVPYYLILRGFRPVAVDDTNTDTKASINQIAQNAF